MVQYLTATDDGYTIDVTLLSMVTPLITLTVTVDSMVKYLTAADSYQ